MKALLKCEEDGRRCTVFGIVGRYAETTRDIYCRYEIICDLRMMKTEPRQTGKKLAGENKNKPIQRRITCIGKSWMPSFLRCRADFAPSKSRRVGIR